MGDSTRGGNNWWGRNDQGGRLVAKRLGKETVWGRNDPDSTNTVLDPTPLSIFSRTYDIACQNLHRRDTYADMKYP